MHNPLVFYKTVVQWNIEQSNTMGSKAAKKTEKDTKEAVEHADNEYDSKRKCVKLEQETRSRHCMQQPLT